jgi:hypothetical protein
MKYGIDFENPFYINVIIRVLIIILFVEVEKYETK